MYGCSPAVGYVLLPESVSIAGTTLMEGVKCGSTGKKYIIESGAPSHLGKV